MVAARHRRGELVDLEMQPVDRLAGLVERSMVAMMGDGGSQQVAREPHHLQLGFVQAGPGAGAERQRADQLGPVEQGEAGVAASTQRRRHREVLVLAVVHVGVGQGDAGLGDHAAHRLTQDHAGQARQVLLGHTQR